MQRRIRLDRPAPPSATPPPRDLDLGALLRARASSRQFDVRASSPALLVILRDAFWGQFKF